MHLQNASFDKEEPFRQYSNSSGFEQAEQAIQTRKLYVAYDNTKHGSFYATGQLSTLES